MKCEPSNDYMTKETFNSFRVSDKLATLYDHLVAIRKCQDCSAHHCIESQKTCNRRFTRVEFVLLIIGVSLVFIVSLDERLLSALTALLKLVG